MNNFIEILRRLSTAKFDFVLVGGLAAGVHGSPMLTQGVDIAYEMTPENLRKLFHAVKDLNPRHRMVHPQRPFL